MNYKIGDKVTVYGGNMSRHITKILEVTAVNARMVTLADGSKWTHSGSEWGSSSDYYFNRNRMTAFQPHHQDEYDRLVVVNALLRQRQRLNDDFHSGSCTNEQIARLANVLKATMDKIDDEKAAKKGVLA